MADDNLLALTGPELLVDAAQELRLELRVGPFGPGKRFDFTIHSETVLREGDTVEAVRRLDALFSGAPTARGALRPPCRGSGSWVPRPATPGACST